MDLSMCMLDILSRRIVWEKVPKALLKLKKKNQLKKSSSILVSHSTNKNHFHTISSTFQAMVLFSKQAKKNEIPAYQGILRALLSAFFTIYRKQIVNHKLWQFWLPHPNKNQLQVRNDLETTALITKTVKHTGKIHLQGDPRWYCQSNLTH